MGSGGGPSYCRFGYYWPVQKLILEEMGYDFKFFHLDYNHPLRIVKTLKCEISAGYNYLQTIRALRLTYRKNRLTDLVDKMLYKFRALEIEKGRSQRVANKIFRKIVDAEDIGSVRKLYKKIPNTFEREVEIDDTTNPLKIAINGEIYVTLEPALNVDINRRLNELGVIVENPVTLRRFYDLGKLLNPFHKMAFQKADERAKPYIEHRCGGEAQECIGETIIYKERGWDGMVHLYPFTCMPHIASKSILPQISKEYDMPVLSLVVDEQTGEAGFQTRLEAYVDLLYRKREGKVGIKTEIESVKSLETFKIY